MVTKRKENPYERDIKRALYIAQRRLSTKQVSEEAGVSWTTARKYLNRLSRKKKVSRNKKGNRVYWRY